jgi:hypothetical protein
MDFRAHLRHTHAPKIAIAIAVAAYALFVMSCSQATFSKIPDPVAGTTTPPTPGGGPGICIPGGGPGTPTTGLVGYLYYLNDGQPRYTSAADYMANGHKVSNPLFLNRLALPTVLFTNGFQYESGQWLSREDGTRLTSFFGMQLWSALRLTSANPPGQYQLALLSDDGTVLTINENGTDTVIINNDGYHPTRFGCAQRPVTFTTSTQMPMELKYFQGPPTHIALTLMWRPWPADGNWQDPACGITGDEVYFDYNQTPSQPTVVYQGMLARGWRPLDANNFVLPGGFTNPCVND